MAFISDRDIVLVFSLFPVGGLQSAIVFSGMGIPCLPFDVFLPFVSTSGHKYAFSSERKKPISSGLNNGPGFLLAPDAGLYFLNKGAFLRPPDSA